MFQGTEDLPSDSSYAEMLCVGCVSKNKLLLAYEGYAVTKLKKNSAANDSLDVGGGASSKSSSELLSESNVALNGSVNEKPSELLSESNVALNGSALNESTASELNESASQCAVAMFDEAAAKARTLFMAEGWRKALCK